MVAKDFNVRRAVTKECNFRRALNKKFNVRRTIYKKFLRKYDTKPVVTFTKF